jgi:hypothetical protein
MVTFGTKEDGYTYYFSRRTGTGQWSKEKLPLSPVSSVLGRIGAEPYLYANENLKRQIVLRRGSEGWTAVAQLPCQGGGGGMVIDQSGCLHLSAHCSKDELAVYGLRQPTGAWSFHLLSYGLGYGPIALAPSGTPHFTYWGHISPQANNALLWVASPGNPEIVLTRSGSILVNKVDLAVTQSSGGATESPHIFVQEGKGALTLASRGDNGQWSLRTIATSPAPKICGYPPTAPGQTCVTEYLIYEMLAIIPATDLEGLRLLYAKNLEQAKLTASCSGSSGECTWEGVNVPTGRLMIAAVTGALVEHTTVLDGVHTQGAATVVDAQGQIHVLFSATGSDELTYLRLGATQ